MKKVFMRLGGMTLAMMSLAMAANQEASACSRITYKGLDSLIIVARSLDWKTPIPTNVYVYPRGIAKQGSDAAGAVTWTSRYGAVYAVSYDAGVTEGMNEKGLVVNGLFCKGTIYSNSTNNNRPPMSLAMFPAWLLDNCANVEDVKGLLAGQNFSISGATFDEGTTSTLHWEVTDHTGASIIIEFQNGIMDIYDVDIAQYPCMTNDPAWPGMKAIIDYWEKKGGKNTLPGTVSSPDRCVRGTYFVKHVEKTGDANLGASILRTVINNSSVPYSYTLASDGEPNVSMTQWRSFSNIRDLRYYFEPYISNGFWYIDLNKCDLRQGAAVKRIVSADMMNAVGDVTDALKEVAPFTTVY